MSSSSLLQVRTTAYWSGVLVDVSRKLAYISAPLNTVHTHARSKAGFCLLTRLAPTGISRRRQGRGWRSACASTQWPTQPARRRATVHGPPLLVVGRRVGPLTPDEVDRAEVAPPQLDDARIGIAVVLGARIVDEPVGPHTVP